MHRCKRQGMREGGVSFCWGEREAGRRERKQEERRGMKGPLRDRRTTVKARKEKQGGNRKRRTKKQTRRNVRERKGMEGRSQRVSPVYRRREGTGMKGRIDEKESEKSERRKLANEYSSVKIESNEKGSLARRPEGEPRTRKERRREERTD